MINPKKKEEEKIRRWSRSKRQKSCTWPSLDGKFFASGPKDSQVEA